MAGLSTEWMTCRQHTMLSLVSVTAALYTSFMLFPVSFLQTTIHYPSHCHCALNRLTTHWIGAVASTLAFRRLYGRSSSLLTDHLFGEVRDSVSGGSVRLYTVLRRFWVVLLQAGATTLGKWIRHFPRRLGVIFLNIWMHTFSVATTTISRQIYFQHPVLLQRLQARLKIYQIELRTQIARCK